MEIVKVLHMNGGMGDTSYANNSLVQRKVITMTKPITEDAITQLYCSTLPKSLVIADLGCSSGPNTLFVVSELIKVVNQLRQKLRHQSPEYQVFLNDLPGNDFNTIFKSLPSFQKNNATASDIYRSIAMHKVTHMCCAPIIFNILLQAEPKEQGQQIITSPVQILTGGAPPPAALLEKVEPLGFHVTHAYGLTEATGPALVCEWQEKWNQLPRDDQAKLKARQGISILTLADVDVKDLKTMASVPYDGKTLGEIVLRGSSIMKGYFKDRKATFKAFKDGWFLTGDVGVVHPDGYLEIKDRSKDVIISGGENISSVEVESVLYKHPRVLEAAVVAMPHPHWGESPCAFVALKKNSAGRTDDVSEAEIISFCRKNLPHFTVPKKVGFLAELPKNSTGKILKNELRAQAKHLVVSENHSNESRPDHSQVRVPRYGDQILQALSRL